ncbi:HAMP domain-containing sensor histidine kinase [Sphaerisporangium sp. B11E5]|uniref:sensor histidine kinase n=1 Tax=Sphaerisporangium sp. B11E5 TaxID=3153563 RepID=UPI00325CE204
MRIPRPVSIRSRYTVAAVVTSLIVLTVIGACLDAAARYKSVVDTFDSTKRVASQWSAAVRAGRVPRVIPAISPVDLIQVVDHSGRVIRASEQAQGAEPLSNVRPPADDRFEEVTACPPVIGCVMAMAIRVTPAPDSLVVYAGVRTPAVLATGRLEAGIVGGVLVLTGLAAWVTWVLVGRTLTPVEAIRARMSQITGSDLSLRVPVPPGGDEIALLAHTANETLGRLEAAVSQQRRFASDASHELRTPIAGLRLRLEEALLHPTEVDPRASIQAALGTVDRMEAIVDDLLVLARLRSGDTATGEPFDLTTLLAEVVEDLATGPPVRVLVEDRVFVRGSRVQVMRVLENLIANAQRHAEGHVTVKVAEKDGLATVEVTDDGAGIAPVDRERVFQRFVRLEEGRRRDPDGTGLGLAISREIAEAHGGSLRVEDSPRGARFVLRLTPTRVEPSVVSTPLAS